MSSDLNALNAAIDSASPAGGGTSVSDGLALGLSVLDRAETSPYDWVGIYPAFVAASWSNKMHPGVDSTAWKYVPEGNVNVSFSWGDGPVHNLEVAGR